MDLEHSYPNFFEPVDTLSCLESSSKKEDESKVQTLSFSSFDQIQASPFETSNLEIAIVEQV